jgi:hypothetical protein
MAIREFMPELRYLDERLGHGARLELGTERFEMPKGINDAKILPDAL